MKVVGIYLLQLIAASAILYGYYHLFLKNKKFHQYNRYYLLAAIIISLFVPLLQIPFYFTQEEADASALLQTLRTIYYSEGDAVVVSSGKANQFDWSLIPFFIYGLVAAILLGKIILSVWKVKKIIKTHPAEELEGVHFLNTAEPGTPFSFFRWLFWNKDIELGSEQGQKIFRHEIFHIQQKHSWDVLFAECISMLLWINPFFHIIKKELRAIHEFLADEFASKEEDKWEYAELLLMQALQTKQNLVTPFFHNQIKRRIAMITNSQKTSHRYLRKLLALPLTVLVVMLLAFTYKNKNIEGSIISANTNGVISTSSDEKVNTNEDKEVIHLLNEVMKKKTDILNMPVTADTTVQPERATLIRVRGTSGYDTTIKPLIVVNDVKLPKGYDLNKMDPSNIESITVLKDQSATSLYGSEAEDGVILITTKDKTPLKINNTPKVIVADGFIVDSASPNKLKEVTVVGYGRPVAIENKVFEQAEQPATFPGGDAAWRKYLERQLNATVAIDNKAPAGTYYAIVQFVIHSDGSVSDIKALTDNGYGVEEEAIRVISKGPKWEPAVQNGKQVPSIRKQRITFVVNDASKPNNPELKEIVVVGYGAQKQTNSEQKSNNPELKEVTVVGYGTQKQTNSTKPAEKIVEGKQIIKEYPIDNLSAIYPNPGTNKVRLLFEATNRGKGEIRITDTNGNLKLTNTTNLAKGKNNIDVNVSSLANGTYIISLKGAGTDKTAVYKLLKQ